MPVLKPNVLLVERVAALRKAHADAGIPRAELDLSGGIDSAVMAGLLVDALGPQNVTLAHTMMSTSGEQTRRAVALAKGLGCRLAVGDFTQIYDEIVGKIVNTLADAGYDRAGIKARCMADPTILGSIRSTLRAPLGRAYNRLMGGGIRHGTGNEDEDRFLRYYQKGGDGEVDSNPIAFLSKGETYQLALALANHFDSLVKYTTGNNQDTEVKAAFLDIIKAMPSADLWGVGDKHTDEGELVKWLGVPFTYSRIDPDTGEYTTVGTIERVNRFLDYTMVNGANPLFDAAEPYWDLTVTLAEESGLFEGLSRSEVAALLKGARKAEKATRHKLNPNLPTYGDRAYLVKEGILTDELPNL